MKTGLIVAGVGVLLAAVYFIAKKKLLPNINAKSQANLPKQNTTKNLAASLITSANVNALWTFIGGVAKAAPASGQNGSGLNAVTAADLESGASPAAASPSIVTESDLNPAHASGGVADEYSD